MIRTRRHFDHGTFPQSRSSAPPVHRRTTESHSTPDPARRIVDTWRRQCALPEDANLASMLSDLMAFLDQTPIATGKKLEVLDGQLTMTASVLPEWWQNPLESDSVHAASVLISGLVNSLHDLPMTVDGRHACDQLRRHTGHYKLTDTAELRSLLRAVQAGIAVQCVAAVPRESTPLLPR